MGGVYKSVVPVKAGGFCIKTKKKIKKNSYCKKENKKSSPLLKC